MIEKHDVACETLPGSAPCLRWSSGSGLSAPPRAIHPVELRRRRAKCRAVVTRLLELEREFVETCNICGSPRRAIVANIDRYGYPARTAMCLDCGLYYLADRLSPKGYAAFYAGRYREITSCFGGGQHPADIVVHQQIVARQLIDSLHGYLDFPPGATLLDVGGSAGRIGLEFQKQLGVSATVLDLSPQEVAMARELGLSGVVDSIEQFAPAEKFHLVLVCSTIEHLQDLRTALRNLRKLLRPDGLLYCDIVDFQELCRAVGHPEAVTKIDHCYWLTQRTAVAIFRAMGFEVLLLDLSRRNSQVGFLLRRCEPLPSPVADPAWIHSQLEELQRRSHGWQELDRHPLDLRERARRALYRAKRFVEKKMG